MSSPPTTSPSPKNTHASVTILKNSGESSKKSSLIAKTVPKSPTSAVEAGVFPGRKPGGVSCLGLAEAEQQNTSPLYKKLVQEKILLTTSLL
jgi:hypothetical protein